MKTFSTLFLAAGLVISSSAFSQQASPGGLALKTRLVSDALPRSGVVELYVTGANQSVVQYKETAEQTGSTSLPMSQIKFFYMLEPEAFLSAKESYQNEQFREARAKFPTVKSRLAPIMGLEDGYFQAAALLEIDSALSLLDWGAVKELTASFPKQSPLTSEMKLDMEIYGLFGKLADKAYDQIISSSKSLLERNKDKLTLDQRARIHFLMGTALAEKNQGTEALDHLAFSIVGAHGGNRELAAAAIQKSLELYEKNPKVDALRQRFNMGEVSAISPVSNPQEIKEAAALVYLFKNVLFPDRVLNPKFDWMLKAYVAPAVAAKNKDGGLVKESEEKAVAPAPPAVPTPGKK